MAYTTIQDSINALLLKQQDAIKNLTFDTASNTDLIMASVIAKKMEEVSKLDVSKMQVSATLAGVTPSAAVANLLSKPDLQQWISGVGNLDLFNAYLSDINILAEIVNTAAIMSDIAISSTAFAAVLASSTAMTAVAASSTAMTAVLASSTAMTAVLASSTAMTAVAASSTAMTAVLASSTALSAINASATAMDALYASSLVQKANYGSGATWSTETTIRNGAALFVRLTTKAGNGGWGEGATGNEWIDFDGTDVMYSERGANPYNHTALSASPRLPMRKFNSALKYRGYAAVEIAYIPLSS